MSVYKFTDPHRGDELAVFEDDQAIALDMYSTGRSEYWQAVPVRDRPSFEVIIPLDEAENLIQTLQDLVAKQRTKAA